MNPAVIFLAALFTGCVSWSMGLLLLHRLRIQMYRQEAWLVAYVLGSACLSLTVFATLAAWIARPWFFVTLGVMAIGACTWRRAWRIGSAAPMAPVPAAWRWIFGALILAFGTYTFVHALAPEVSPDGIAYHLGTVNRWFVAGGLEWRTTNMYANMPMGIEMLFLFAYSFGRHSASALVHWQFYIVLALLLLNLGRRFGNPTAGAIAGLLVFLSPVASIDGASSYVDVATAAVVLALFSMLLVFEEQRRAVLLIPIGALAGFAYACKMTGFPALPFALGYVAWALRRERPWFSIGKRLVLVGAVAVVFIAPWMIRNTLMMGNPVSPFLNKLFPNPYIRISFEEDYRAMHRNYYGHIKSWTQIPVEVTVKGATLQGVLGPVFLLAPVALVALRWPLGRRALIAALVFALPYPSNIGTRFLLLPLPFLSLAMGLVFSQWRGTSIPIVLLHAWLSWPSVISGYSDPYVWRLAEFRWKQALRIEPEDSFLSRFAPGIVMAKMIEEKVPAHGRVLSFGGIAEAYTTREVLVVYQAGLNNLLGDILSAGFSPDQQGSRRWMFRFPAMRLQRLRLVQTKSIPQNWAVSEMRVFSPAGLEFPRNHSWRLRAQPNPWDVQLAFDNCPITRWISWQASRPGDRIELDLGQPLEVAAVGVDMAPDQANAAMRLETEGSSGVWKPIASEAQLVATAPVLNSRLTATDDLKRFGITHIAISNDDYVAQDLKRNQTGWGISLIGETASARLYRLD